MGLLANEKTKFVFIKLFFRYLTNLIEYSDISDGRCIFCVCVLSLLYYLLHMDSYGLKN